MNLLQDFFLRQVAVLMNILILTNRIPYPEHDGGNKAVAQVLQSFLQNEDMSVSLLSMNTTKHFVPIDTLPSYYQKLVHLDTVAIDNSIKWLPALTHLISGKSYIVSRFINDEFAQKLKVLLQHNKYDFIWLEGLYVTPYIDLIKLITDTPICYRQHNVEYKIWENLAVKESNFLKKLYLEKLAKQLKKYEETQTRKANIILPISPVDEAINRDELHLRNVSYLLSFGLNIEQESSAAPLQNPLSVFHIGAMDWMPNQEGIDWFLAHVWPKVLAAKPHATFHFAGRNMPQKYFHLDVPNVFCAGEIPDAKLWTKDKGILIVPIRAGSGIRIKTLDAMLAHKPVVSTPTGASGLLVEDGRHILLADDADTFAAKIISLMNDSSFYEKLTHTAFLNVATHYDVKKIFASLQSFLLRYLTG